MSITRPPVVLVVLDGWGLSKDPDHNAILLGRTPAYDELLERYPYGSLITSGAAVGLPEGQMGNSEVGHMNLGAGRIVYQDLSRIDNSIRDGDFFSNEALLAATARCADGRHALHLVGLVSDGGVHSHLRHLVALIDLARRQGVTRLFVHAADGWAGYGAHGRRRLPPRGGVGHAGVGGWPHRLSRRTLLRHGPRQALGSNEARIRRADIRARPLRDRRIDAGSATLTTRTSRMSSSSLVW